MKPASPTSMALAIATRRWREMRREMRLREEAEVRLRASERRFATTFASSPFPLIVSSLTRRLILDVNEEFIRATGYDRRNAVGRPFASLNLTSSVEAHEALRAKLLTDGRFRNEELAYRDSAGVLHPALCSADAIEYDGEPAALIAFNDITERKRLEKELAYQAFHDPLTGLANRALFRNRVQHEITRGARSGCPTAVLFLDLDDFKRVNDTVGHAVGDELLVAVTRRILQCAREADTCARLGGDEFAILLADAEGERAACTLAERIIATLHAPFALSSTVAHIGVSIGIAMADASSSVDDLLRNADLAMYLSKTSGKNRYTVFEPVMHSEVVERMTLESELRGALARGEFVLHYQPIASIASGEIVGIEALVRWLHPERGVIPPSQFIPMAEQTGVILEVGQWVLEEACREARGVQERYPRPNPLWVSVNVSGRQIDHPDFVEQVEQALMEAALDPDSLVLEITEGVLLHNDAATLDRLQLLRDRGIHLAIDDFGTGYSSLAYLQRFPFNILKIDKCFTDRLGTGIAESPLCRAVIGLGATLSVTTIAEGIETPQQWERLRELGCDLGQGFVLSRPMSAEELAVMLDSGAKGIGLLQPEEPPDRLAALDC